MPELARHAKAYQAAVQQDLGREQLILEHLPQIKYIAHRISTKLPSIRSVCPRTEGFPAKWLCQ